LAVPIFTLMKVSVFLSDILVSRKFFTIPMIAGLVVNFGVLISIFLFASSWGVASMAAGMMAAHALNIAMMLRLMKKEFGWEFISKKPDFAPHVSKNVLFSQLGSGAAIVASYVPMFLLSGFSSGTVSSLNFGRQVADLPNSLLTQQASAVSGIKFNEMTAHGDGPGLHRAFSTAAAGPAFLLVPVAVAGSYYAPEVIKLLFGRGQFGPVSVKLSASFMRVFLLAVPFNAVATLVARLFMAEQKISQSFWYQVAYNAAILVLALLLIKKFGALGYPAALLVLQVANLPICLPLLKAYAPSVRYSEVLGRLFRITAYEAALFLPVAAMDWLLLRQLPLVPRMTIASAVYVLLISLCNKSFNLEPESRELVGKLLRLPRKLFPKF
ncbi:MAG TPA: lipid II flippase MurJ, partial [Elusimicrobiales bacterium]|nr:lipid II flippase MurJ [Elusimicrobiales bacterium]